MPTDNARFKFVFVLRDVAKVVFPLFLCAYVGLDLFLFIISILVYNNTPSQSPYAHMIIWHP